MSAYEAQVYDGNGNVLTNGVTSNGLCGGYIAPWNPWNPSPNSWPCGTITLTNPWPTEPETCIGKAHVFECEHVTQCKCGKVTRLMGDEVACRSYEVVKAEMADRRRERARQRKARK